MPDYRVADYTVAADYSTFVVGRDSDNRTIKVLNEVRLVVSPTSS
jgi:hypothetical protein